MKTLDELLEEAKKGIEAATYEEALNGIRFLIKKAEYNSSLMVSEEGATKENRKMSIDLLLDLLGACHLINVKLLLGEFNTSVLYTEKIGRFD